MTPQVDARALRRALRIRRRTLSKRERSAASHLACQGLMHHLNKHLPARTRGIGLYHAMAEELDTAPLIEALIRADFKVYLPRLHPTRAHKLQFLHWQPRRPLQKNRFGIPEPIPGTADCVPAWSLGALIMPLVAVDAHGHRMGMGGGYYDGTLDYRRPRPAQPQLIGYGYAFQRVECLPTNPWDIALDFYCSPEGLFSFL